MLCNLSVAFGLRPAVRTHRPAHLGGTGCAVCNSHPHYPDFKTRWGKPALAGLGFWGTTEPFQEDQARAPPP